MTVISVDTNLDELSITLVADFNATPDRVWELWADPRKLEKWWGPPGYPATFTTHDLTPGSMVLYFMTGPEGQRHYGFWKITAVDPPGSLEFQDGFANEDGTPTADTPGKVRVTLSEHDGGTRMELLSTNETREQLEQLVAMGMVEGITAAVGQMDALLAGRADGSRVPKNSTEPASEEAGSV